MRAPRVRYLSVAIGKREDISDCPNFGPRGSVTGMRRLYYGYAAKLVRCGAYVYNVTSGNREDLYDRAR